MTTELRPDPPPPKASKPEVGMLPTTIFYAPPDTREMAIAAMYVKQTYPNTKAKVASAIELAELSRAHVIVVLSRIDPTALDIVVEDKKGNLRQKPITDLKPMVAEIRETHRINVADHFEGSDEWNSRLVDDKFANDLAGKIGSAYWPRDRRITRT